MPPEPHWHSTLDEVREDVKTILNYLHGEQGTNGLMTRMRVVEGRVDDHDNDLKNGKNWLIGTITTLGLAILGWFVTKGGGE